MLEVFELIETLLSDLDVEVFNESIPEIQPFPYMRYHIPSINQGELRQDVLLYIDIWDKNTDIVPIESICSEVDLRLNRVKYNGDSIQISIYRNDIWKLNIPDEDPKIRRRRLVYLVRVYKIGE